ncbi:MAG: DUF370 domain-containing protein [Eubacteriales bacterium]|jgi:hypothetical protein|nr:DUF370 domain-containing protein [Eubacteriales bacterium]MDD3073098.1 DUF370 domain-containing protein [Eubacteriales bacterium]MDD4768403.1 DUF370 domain-containing protein [Eubacteriales bacterium]
MFLHLGAEVSVYAGDVIGIFDYRLSGFDSFKEFLAFSKWSSQVFVLEGKTKSIVITNDKIYLTPVSRATLVRRWEKYIEYGTGHYQSIAD